MTYVINIQEGEYNMPRFDGTGPMGQGPMTGGGRGTCRGGMNSGFGGRCGRGLGMGRGAGFCRRTGTDRQSLLERKQTLEEELSEVEQMLGDR